MRIEFNKKQEIRLYIYFTLLSALFFTYMPVFHAYYGVQDDFYFWMMETRHCRNWPSYDFLVYQTGRPLLAYSGCAMGYFADSFNDLNFIRGLSVFILGLIAYVLYKWMHKNGIDRVHAILLSLIICTLPSFQVHVGQATALPLLISTLISAFSVLTAYKSTFIAGINRYTLFAISLMIVSLSLYQPTAMFSWVMIAVMVMGTGAQNWKLKQKKIYCLFAINIVAIGIYFICTKITVGLFLAKQGILPRPGAYELNFLSDFAVNINVFTNLSLFNALNLWNITPNSIFIQIQSFLFALAILIAITKLMKDRNNTPINNSLISSILEKYFLVLCLLPLSNLPTLASNISVSAYRTQTALASLVVILMFWVLNSMSLILNTRGRSIFITTICLIGSIIGVYTAHFNMTNYYSFSQSLETKFIKSALHQNDMTKFKKIHFIIPDPNKTKSFVLPHNRPDIDFGFTTTVNDLAASRMIMAMMSDLPVETRATLTNIIKFENITAGTKENHKDYDESTLVIDMTRLEKFY